MPSKSRENPPICHITSFQDFYGQLFQSNITNLYRKIRSITKKNQSFVGRQSFPKLSLHVSFSTSFCSLQKSIFASITLIILNMIIYMQPYCQTDKMESNTPIIPIPQKAQLTQIQNFKYYEEHKRLLETSFLLHQQITDLRKLAKSLISTLSELDRKMEDTRCGEEERQKENYDENKPKRVRRTNNMIEKNYKCPGEKCEKVYASEGSLQQHMKLKHPNLDVKYKEEEDKKESTQHFHITP